MATSKDKNTKPYSASIKHLSMPGSKYANGSVAAAGAVRPSASRPRDMNHALLLHNIGQAGAAGSRSFSGKDVGGFYKLKD